MDHGHVCADGHIDGVGECGDAASRAGLHDDGSRESLVAAGATLDIEADMGVGTTAIGGALNNAGDDHRLLDNTLTLNGTGNLGGSGNSHLPGLTLNGNGLTTTLASGITLLGGFKQYRHARPGCQRR